MKHRTESASSGELACPHLSDHPTRQAKERTNPNHGRSVPIFLVPLRDLFGHSGSELRGDLKTPVIPQIPHFRSNPSARSADSPVHRLSPFHRILNVTVSLCHKVTTAKNTFETRRNTRKNTRRNTLKLPKNTQNTKKNTFFFFERRNVDFDPADAFSPRRYFATSRRRCHHQFDLRTCLISSPMARAARTEDQDEGVRSFDTRQTLDFPTQNAFLKLNLASLFTLQ